MAHQPEIRLRSADSADAQAIAPFHLACWLTAYAGLVPQDYLDDLAKQDRVAAWQQRLAEPDTKTVVAIADGAVVGLARTAPSGEQPPRPDLELRALYVAAQHQGNGLGQRLVRAVLGDRPASLWVFEDNASARRFYRRNGWRATGERRRCAGTTIPEVRLTRPGSL